jgi:hypothetical protein
MARSNQDASAASSPSREEARTDGLGRFGLLARFGWWRRANGSGDAPHQASTTIARAAAAPSDAIVPFSRLGRAPRVLFAVMIGLDPAVLERSLAAIRASSDPTGGGIEPLCLTDCERFELFRRHGLLFEYFPPPAQRERFASDLDWDLYTLRRLARLRRKWNPVRIVAFGPTAQAQIQRWRASPFEDDGIRDLIGAPEAGGVSAGIVGN